MHFLSTLAVAALAATAQAGSHLHQRHAHHYYRRGDNTTAPVSSESMTTSTVFATSLITVTSCEPTVTSCPAQSTVVTTTVIPVSTTVCPVSEHATSDAQSTADATGPTVPSSGYGTGPSSTDNPVPTAPPLGTGVPTPHVFTPNVNQTSTIVIPEETDTTLTYTLGLGESTTVVTTTIRVQTTRTSTLFVTVPASVADSAGETPAPAPESPAGEAPAGEGAGVPTVVKMGESEVLMTVESTSTQFVTVSAIPVGAPGATLDAAGNLVEPTNVASPGGVEGEPTGAASCPAPTTVTVTAKETVTTTVTADAEPTMLPTAPYNNGTEATSTSSVVASTGFLTVSTGSPVPSGEAEPKGHAYGYY